MESLPTTAPVAGRPSIVDTDPRGDGFDLVPRAGAASTLRSPSGAAARCSLPHAAGLRLQGSGKQGDDSRKNACGRKAFAEGPLQIQMMKDRVRTRLGSVYCESLPLPAP
jgi:hypothetical protein